MLGQERRRATPRDSIFIRNRIQNRSILLELHNDASSCCCREIFPLFKGKHFGWLLLDKLVAAFNTLATLIVTRIDGMVYTRGSAEDYHMIANITGDKGWSWDRLQYYIRKVYTLFLPR